MYVATSRKPWASKQVLSAGIRIRLFPPTLMPRRRARYTLTGQLAQPIVSQCAISSPLREHAIGAAAAWEEPDTCARCDELDRGLASHSIAAGDYHAYNASSRVAGSREAPVSCMQHRHPIRVVLSSTVLERFMSVQTAAALAVAQLGVAAFFIAGVLGPIV